MSRLLAIVVGTLCLFAGREGFSLDRTISVSGTCLRSVLSDRASITVTSDFQEKDLKVASKKATDSYEAVKKAIQKLNLKDLELSTSEYTVNSVNEWEKNKNVLKGYRARMGLDVVTSETGRLGEVIAIAAAQNVKDVGALRMFLSDVKERTEREACLEEAIQHAQSKGARMAKAAGAKIGRVLTLTEESSSLSSPQAPRLAMAKLSYQDSEQENRAGPTTDTAAQKLQLSVHAVYQID